MKWQQLIDLKHRNKQRQVFIITLNNEHYFNEDNAMIVFEKQKDAYDFIKKQNYKLGEWHYISQWLTNIEIY